MKIRGMLLGLVAGAVGMALVLFLGARSGKDIPAQREEPAAARAGGEKPARARAKASARAERREGKDAAAEERDAASSEEARRADEEEKAVEDFDGLTDAWMEPAADGVTMEDVQKFIAAFRRVPKSRQDECIHRALNLVPDANVMLLAGILMDKTQDREIVESVYNDILNRSEEVKNPILREIFKDRKHPCWADTAWILDVTGFTPGEQAKDADGN